MFKKSLAIAFVFLFSFSILTPHLYAIGGKQAAASLLLPTTGQTMNGEFHETKTKVMAGVEIAALTTITILGLATGGGVVWVGLGPLLANHAWSSYDAYSSAQQSHGLMIEDAQNQILEANRAVDLSRQSRYENAQYQRMDLKERLRMAKEQAYL